ncbi:ATP-binding protein [Dialister succinatiphilus]|uniref:ATP-binding protein n=1 Tax=Dialister succinatiphilus TaxID=487173 RepID=UPI004025D9DA
MDEVSRNLINQLRELGSQSEKVVTPPAESKQNNPITALSRAGIPKRYYRATFEALAENGCPEDVRPMAEEAWKYAKHLKENAEAGRGLLFFGEVGRMKTTLACCIAREAIKQGVGVYFISMPELMDTLTSMSRNKDPTEFRKFEDKIKHTRILILDDFGAEYPAGWVLNKVDAIITNRYNNMLPIIITTNMLPDEIKERYVQRVFDRLRSTSKVIGTYGDSLRRNAE